MDESTMTLAEILRLPKRPKQSRTSRTCTGEQAGDGADTRREPLDMLTVDVRVGGRPLDGDVYCAYVRLFALTEE